MTMTMTILRIQLRSTTTRRASYILRGRWKKASQSRRREEDVITGSGVESEERFDLDSESDFDDDIDGDKDMEDENMWYKTVVL